jgi:ABC-type phosphate transport system permease subunit
MMNTLKTNWRDIVLFLVVGLGFAFLTDWLIAVSTSSGLSTSIASALNFLSGFSKFVGATLAATFLGLISWPTFNKFANDDFSFQKGWDALGDKGKFITVVAVLMGYAVVAAICFA